METIGLAFIAIVLFEVFKSKAATPPAASGTSNTGNGQSGSPKKPFLGVDFTFSNRVNAMADSIRQQAAQLEAEAKAKAKMEKEAQATAKKLQELLAALNGKQNEGAGGNAPVSPPVGGQGGLPPNTPQTRYQRASAITVVELEGVVMSAIRISPALNSVGRSLPGPRLQMTSLSFPSNL